MIVSLALSMFALKSAVHYSYVEALLPVSYAIC
jgi:hypothetical protein